MADNATAAGGEPTPVAGAPANPTAPSGTGTDPAKQPDNASQGFDPTALSDDEFAKFYSDPRTFNHPRFKALNEQAKEAERLKSEREQAENDQLAKDKKFEELATKRETEATQWKSRFEQSQVDNRIVTEASKLGITDLDAATKLLDRTNISVDEQGNVSGVAEAIKALADAKPYLVDKSKSVPVIGSPTNPQNGNTTTDGSVKTFKASEIRDPAFYREHEKEITAAMKVPGAIVNDLQPAK